MKTQISILFDAYHLYHLAQFEPLMTLLEKMIGSMSIILLLVKTEKKKLNYALLFY